MLIYYKHLINIKIFFFNYLNLFNNILIYFFKKLHLINYLLYLLFLQFFKILIYFKGYAVFNKFLSFYYFFE